MEKEIIVVWAVLAFMVFGAVMALITLLASTRKRMKYALFQSKYLLITRRLFAFFYLVSLIVIVALIFYGKSHLSQNNSVSLPDFGPGRISQAPEASNTSGSEIMVLVSLFTSVITLLGMVSTMVLAWLKEKRTARAALLDNELKGLQIQQLRQELSKKK